MTVDKSDYRFQAVYPTSPDAVYEALTTQAGIRGWWANDARVPETEGETIRLRWSPTGWTDLRIDRLSRPALVEWTCSDCHVEAFDDPADWVGTRIRFELRQVESGTELTCVHRGMLALGCAQICVRGWGEHLGTSLPLYLATGSGQPVGMKPEETTV